MAEKSPADVKTEAFFENLWRQDDPWQLAISPFERLKYERQASLLHGRHYDQVLEIGCGNGCFTHRLAQVAGRVVAVDVSPTAIAQAREFNRDVPNVDLRTANAMQFPIESEGPWDLVVISETIYYLGWLYSFFDVWWLATRFYEATRSGGELLMANTCGGVDDYLLRPSLIRSYHALLSNVGYVVQADEIFQGVKNGTQIEVLISLYKKPEHAPARSAPDDSRIVD